MPADENMVKIHITILTGDCRGTQGSSPFQGVPTAASASPSQAEFAALPASAQPAVVAGDHDRTRTGTQGRFQFVAQAR